LINKLIIRNKRLTPIPYWSKVGFLKDKKEIEFQPGLNIIYGPNGSGKSTLLSALAVLLHVKESNWPVVSKDSLGPFMRPSGFTTGLLLEHDGGPARYLGIADPGFPPKKDVASQRVRLETAKETKYKALHDMSHGQATVAKLVSFLSAKPTKVRYAISKAKLTGSWERLWEVGTESLANVKAPEGEPRQVILLDEVDRSLDFAKQHEVWRELRELAKTTQIVIASHSPFAVSAPGAHYIETTPDYLLASRQALHLLMQDLEAQDAAKGAAAE
jgi:predicted ATPase